jgi:hypothetical protein
LFNVIRLNDDIFRSREGPKEAFAHAVWFLARQLDVGEQNVWDSLDGELFATSTFGYRARRRGKQTVASLAPPALREWPHRGLAHRLVAVRRRARYAAGGGGGGLGGLGNSPARATRDA